MGYENASPASFPASADLSASQFCAVALNTTGQLVLPAAGGQIIGILDTKPAAIGRAGKVFLHGSGIRKGKMSGVVNPGLPVKVDAAGKFLLAVSTNLAVGIYVGPAASAANDVGSILLTGMFIVP